MIGILGAVAKFVGLKPDWTVRLARGYSVVVRFAPGFRLGTIEGGHDFVLSMRRNATGWRERVRGYNSGDKAVTNFEGLTSANPNEGTFSIFGAVFRFDRDGAVYYERDGLRELVGELHLPRGAGRGGIASGADRDKPAHG